MRACGTVDRASHIGQITCELRVTREEYILSCRVRVVRGVLSLANCATHGVLYRVIYKPVICGGKVVHDGLSFCELVT